MPLKIRKPDDLPAGPVIYVPPIRGNRDELADPFRVEVKVLTYTEVGGMRSFVTDPNNPNINDLYHEYIRQSVKRVWGIEIQDINTNEILRPKNADELIDALCRTEAALATLIITDLGNACMSFNALAEGEIGNLKRRQQLLSISGPKPEDGPAPAAGESTIPNTTPGAMPLGSSADVMGRPSVGRSMYSQTDERYSGAPTSSDGSIGS